MIVYPVLVAFRTAEWLPIAVESYLAQFPHDRVLIVDNNPRPGETGWSPASRRESRWMRSHPRIDVIQANAAVPGAPITRIHGAGIDLALEWCRSRGADVMLHIEPDCLITGKGWRENLVRAIEQGAWMAGAHRKPWGPIHPTPSAWLVRQVRTSFAMRPREPAAHPRFSELVLIDVLRATAEPAGIWEWAKDHWDTGDKAWFDAAVHDKAALVEAPGFQHFWLGTSGHKRPLRELIATFPEIAAWFARHSTENKPRLIEDCWFRHDVRRARELEVACCGLLQQLTGVVDSRLCDLGRDVCQACRDLGDPSLSSINPVIASRLFRLAESISATGGVDGCDRASALHLRAFAEANLDLRLSSEGPPRAPRRTDQPCRHLGDETGFRVRQTAAGFDHQPAFECRHPDHLETTLDQCARCRDWCDNPSESAVPIERLVPPPRRRLGPPVRRWAVGVTTAPRPRPTLKACLDSLGRAGWQEPRLFVDSAVTIPERYSELPLTFRESKLGPWPNYYLALVELLMREPDADAFMLVQDDVIFDDRHDMKAYLEAILWPADPIAAVSLYCSKAYTRPQAGWHALERTWVWGALAFIFSPHSAQRFVTDQTVFEHRRDPDEGLLHIDIQIGRWAHAAGWPIFFPTPSLVQHIGDSSSLWSGPDSRAMGERRADRFIGDIDQADDET